jgi:polyphosphate kinase
MSKDQSKKNHYINTELSLLEFNHRVLLEAQNKNTPLLEKLKFLSIFSKNLNEFFMIKIVDLRKEKKILELKKIQKKVKFSQKKQLQTYKDLTLDLAKNKIYLTSFSKLSLEQTKKANQIYQEKIKSFLHPEVFDKSTVLNNLSLYIVCELENLKYHCIKLPKRLEKIITLDSQTFIWIEDLIENNLQTFFKNKKIINNFYLRATRDRTYSLGNHKNSYKNLQQALNSRDHQEITRLEISSDTSPNSQDYILATLALDPLDFFLNNQPFTLEHLDKLYGLDFPEHKYPSFNPKKPLTDFAKKNIFSILQTKDIMTYQPFCNFTTILDFIKVSCLDPLVSSIKITLYRFLENSKIISYLSQAASKGKNVVAIIEIKARFDEKKNIAIAKKLENSGVQVLYGFNSHKIHAKMILVSRKENNHIKHYCHFSTGNYNEDSATCYTDLNLLTANPKITSETNELFKIISVPEFNSNFSLVRKKFKSLIVAPFFMKEFLLTKIKRLTKLASEGKSCRICFKINHLQETSVIDHLYRAGEAGVSVKLIVRSICCLRPCKNIEVRSIVGRFLEHSRIYQFKDPMQDLVFIGSADCMRRNLEKRIEVILPIWDKDLQQQLHEGLNLYLQDNHNSYILETTGTYRKLRSGNINAQETTIIKTP